MTTYSFYYRVRIKWGWGLGHPPVQNEQITDCLYSTPQCGLIEVYNLFIEFAFKLMNVGLKVGMKLKLQFQNPDAFLWKWKWCAL